MPVHFQFGNGIHLRSALVALGLQFEGSYAEWLRRTENPNPWRHFHKVEDVCEARFRTRSAWNALEGALDVAMRCTPITVEERLRHDPSHTSKWYDLYGTTLSSGRPLRWYSRGGGDPDKSGIDPEEFPHLRLELSLESSREATFFVCGSGPGDRRGASYRLIADPWADHHVEVGEFLAALLTGEAEVGPTKPADLRLDVLDEALAAAGA